MFIVTFPYSVYQGGYWSLFAMVFFAYITYYTGKILVYCLYEQDERGQHIRVRTSYIQIAEDVWGKRYGGKIVQAAQLIELVMTCVLYVLLCGDLLQKAFPTVPLDLTSWIMLSSIFLLPCAFLQNYRAVARLSFYNTVSHACINIIIIGYCLTSIGQWHWSEVQFGIDIRQVPVALGIVVFSYTSQIFLPALEGSMQKRHRFECMLFWTHALAALFKCMFAWIGFLTFGNNTREVITNNLPDNTFRFITNIFLFLKALLSYPLPYFAACDIVQNRMFETRKEAEDNKFTQTLGGTCYSKDGLFKDWAVLIRLLFVVFTMLLGAGIPHFATLMGLVGNFTGTMLSFVWPCVFHLKLKGHTLSPATKIWEYTIIGIGIVCGFIGIFTSSIQLIQELQND
ncbi:vesicular inhibitory amino acid transporter-like [Convolutriloba macropyga]|uniref:vesicular inhibitory amino acid transporter-like n=1 Tax=Convolutriloba macropyga TaxID=536237 RepID=UPI003F51ECCA